MYDSHLIDMLKVFSADELSALRLFVKSPFFNRSNRSAAIVALYEYLYQVSPDYDPALLQKDTVYARIFPGEPQVKSRLEKTMTELTKVIRMFIAYQYAGIQEGSAPYQLAQSKFYREAGMEVRFLKSLDHLRQELSALDCPGFEDLFHAFLAEEMLHDHRIVYYNKKDDANLVSTIRHLDRYYFAQRLAFTASFQNISYITRLNPDDILPVADLFDEVVGSQTFANTPLLEGYYHACRILACAYPASEEHFTSLRSLLETRGDRLPKEHRFNLGNILRNHCVVQMNAGRQEYLAIYMDLLKSQLENGILYHKGGLLVSILQNMIQTGLKAGEYEWVRKVLEDHQHRIAGTHYPEDVYRYNLSNYYFHMRDYARSLEFLTYQYEDVWYLIRARNLEIKIFYERGEWLLLDAKLESFKIYLIRLSQKHLPDHAREAYLQFVNATKRLFHAQANPTKPHLQRLLAQTRDSPNLVDREWLLDKTEALMPA